MEKKDGKLGLIRSQEFDCEIKDRRSSANVVVDHISRLEINDASEPPHL